MPPCKSSLSYQNKKRDWQLFQAYYFKMLAKLHGMVRFRQTRFKIKSKILLLDSTSISLWLSLFDWARFRKKKGAIKLHTLLDFETLRRWYQGGSWFVVRLKTSVRFHRGKERPLPEDRHPHILVGYVHRTKREKHL